MLSWSFILGGVLPRHPRLSVAFLEAGAGWVPYFMDRADEHYRIMSHLVKTEVPRPPGEYFREQCFVACEPDDSLDSPIHRNPEILSRRFLWLECLCDERLYVDLSIPYF